MINREKLSSHWNEYKGKIREKWNKITDEDLQKINGKWDHLIQTIQQRYNLSKEDAEKELHRWCEACHCNSSSCKKEHHKDNPGKGHQHDDWKKRKAG